MHKPTRQVSTLLSISSHDIACALIGSIPHGTGPYERYLSERVLTRRVVYRLSSGTLLDGERESTGEHLRNQVSVTKVAPVTP